MGFQRKEGFLKGLSERKTLSMWTMVALFCKSLPIQADSSTSRGSLHACCLAFLCGYQFG